MINTNAFFDFTDFKVRVDTHAWSKKDAPTYAHTNTLQNVSRFFVVFLFFLPLFIDLVTDKVQPLSR